MMLLMAAITLAALVGVPGGPLALIAIFYPPFHLYRQLRHAYRLSRPGALIRASILTIFALVALGLFVAGLFMFGLIS